MATLHAMLGFLREEVETAIEGISVESQQTNAFKRRSLESRAEAPIEETFGDPRTFELNLQQIANFRSTWSGCDFDGFEFDLPIKVVYGKDEKWARAAADDHVKIVKQLRQNGTTVTGVHIREINNEASFALVPSEQDHYQIATTFLNVILEADS